MNRKRSIFERWIDVNWHSCIGWRDLCGIFFILWVTCLCHIWWWASLTIVCDEAFCLAHELSSVVFDADSRLTDLARNLFAETDLTSFRLPASIEVAMLFPLQFTCNCQLWFLFKIVIHPHRSICLDCIKVIWISWVGWSHFYPVLLQLCGPCIRYIWRRFEIVPDRQMGISQHIAGVASFFSLCWDSSSGMVLKAIRSMWCKERHLSLGARGTQCKSLLSYLS
jgi:hypothetical protein